jgi:outer membrane biosynthesis protein TonB
VIYTDTLRRPRSSPATSPTRPGPTRRATRASSRLTGLTLAGTFEPTLTLGIGRMREPMEAMRACLHELVTHWGLDATSQETLSRKATPIDQLNWARQSMEHYPTDMLRAGKSARLPIRLLVGTDGKPRPASPSRALPSRRSSAPPAPARCA